MAFSPRTFDEILTDMIAYVQVTTEISDFTVGSVVRTILEAAALEDDEQYYQMVQLLDLYSFTTASGDDLDRRLSDFDLVRKPATGATVKIRFYNNNLISSQLSIDSLAGSSQLTAFNISSFPTPSPTYVVRVGEGTSRVQDLVVSGVNYSTGVFTLATPVLYNVFLGDRISYVGTGLYTINLGTAVVAPATTAESAKTFTTQEIAYILPGNFYSNEVIAYGQGTGINTNVGARRITQFNGASPFPGAGVINFTASEGGRNRESDPDFRVRAARHIQSLSRGTPLSLVNAALTVVDPATNQRVTSANIIEDYQNDEVIIYIDDGTGFTPDTAQYSSDSLVSSVAPGNTVITLNDVSNFPNAGKILILSPLGVTEYISYISKDNATNTLTLSGTGAAQSHIASDLVLGVDTLTAGSEPGQRRFRLQNFPVIRGTFRLFVNQGTGWVEYQEGTDFFLNKGTGDLQLSDSIVLSSGSIVVGYYSYYTNLIAEVQRTLEGNIDNSTLYPGFKAAGIFLAVEAPSLKRITVVASITAQDGFNEQDLWDPVRQNIESYINSRKIGEDVIRSKLIDVAFNVNGLADISISFPVSNVVILENELPVAFDSTGASLVTIS